ncbi:Tyrosine-protein kinase [Aphelenchoides besseyi]|nr:Tyrosine-protein kinase [Aphelenchoides besseyi]KAI6235437.1 Tyrosine-protein kinase [Aphelenchoides besseyi]
MSDEHTNLTFFHGALPNEDADKLLKLDGDFLIQSKNDPGHTRPRLIVAVKKNRIRRFELVRDGGGYRFLARLLNGLFAKRSGKQFPSVKSAVEYFQSCCWDIGNGEKLQLKRAVPKGKFQLVHKDVRLIKKIGSGAYGTVYKGMMTKERRLVAVKRIDSDGRNEQGLVDMMKEARVMQLYDHKNIVKFYGFIVDRTPYLLVMELCIDGSVEDKLRSLGAEVSANRRVDMSTQAARGLEYLHHKKTIHRDLATRNCLLSGTVLKLADFGMCRKTEIYKVDLSKPQNVRWLAPEVWRTGETNFTTDIYAFGITLWEFFETPYNSPYCTWKAITVKERVMSGYRMQTPDLMPDPVASVMKRCWDQDQSRRPTATELRKDMDTINKGLGNDSQLTDKQNLKTPVCATPKTGRSRSMILDPNKSRVGTAIDKASRSLQTAVGSRPRTPPNRSHG